MINDAYQWTICSYVVSIQTDKDTHIVRIFDKIEHRIIMCAICYLYYMITISACLNSYVITLAVKIYPDVTLDKVVQGTIDFLLSLFYSH